MRFFEYLRKHRMVWTLVVGLLVFGGVIALSEASSPNGSVSGGPMSTPDTTNMPTITTNGTGQTQVRWNNPASSSSTSCTVSLSGHDAEVIFSSPDHDVSPSCQAVIELGAQAGQLWINQPSQPSEGGWGQVCNLASGDITATVYDDGGQDYGRQECTGLLGTGTWVEQSTTTNSSSYPTTTTTPASQRIMVECPLDASTGAVLNNKDPTWCWWVSGPGTGAERNPPPNPVDGVTYNVDVGQSCTWHDQGKDQNSGQAEVFTCN